MFTTPTVFVLGAGVSAPFGFPVGRQMKDAICNGGYQPAVGKRVDTLTRGDMAAVLAEGTNGDCTPTVVTEFMDAFRESDLYSVDAWLEANGDAQLLKAGKAAIAGVIVHAESRLGDAAVEQDWFAWLWNNMWTPDIEDLSKNRVTFVTFNYDRLFEWKLQRQVRATYLRATEAQRERVLKFLFSRVIHPHGVLGGNQSIPLWQSFGAAHFWPNFVGREIVANLRPKMIHAIADLAPSISIVSETPTSSAELTNAKVALQQAIRGRSSRLVFLGFSYDERNILKLEMDEDMKDVPDLEQQISQGIISAQDEATTLDETKIIGSAMDLKRGERSSVRDMFKNRIALGGVAVDAVEFCRSHIRVPRRPNPA